MFLDDDLDGVPTARVALQKGSGMFDDESSHLLMLAFPSLVFYRASPFFPGSRRLCLCLLDLSLLLRLIIPRVVGRVPAATSLSALGCSDAWESAIRCSSRAAGVSLHSLPERCQPRIGVGRGKKGNEEEQKDHFCSKCGFSACKFRFHY